MVTFGRYWKSLAEMLGVIYIYNVIYTVNIYIYSKYIYRLYSIYIYLRQFTLDLYVFHKLT